MNTELTMTRKKIKRLTKVEIKKVCKLYETGNHSRIKLGKMFDVSNRTIGNILNRNGYEAPKRYARKYPTNENFFDVVDNQDKAYVLGLLYADGCNMENHNRVTIALQEKDVDIVKAVRDLIQPTKPLSYVKPRKETHSPQYRLDVYSSHISKQLAKLGCVQAKSLILKFPTNDQVPEYLLNHFLRGYCDRDGSINKRYVSLIGATSFILSAKDMIESELDIRCCDFRHKRSPGVHILSMYKKSGNQFLDWLYDDANLYMERKYQRYLWRARNREYGSNDNSTPWV